MVRSMRSYRVLSHAARVDACIGETPMMRPSDLSNSLIEWMTGSDRHR